MPMTVGTEARAVRAAGGNVAMPDVEGVQQVVAEAHCVIGVPSAVVAHADTVVRLCTGVVTTAEHPEPAKAKTAAVL